MRFEDTDELKGAEFINVDLSGVRMRNVDLRGAKVMEAMLVGARFSGLIDGLVVNDVEVAPLIHAELIRRHPERAKLFPGDIVGAREAWTVIQDLWQQTKSRAASLPEDRLHERVDEEWSFLESMRHLVFVTDAWVLGRIEGKTDHFHPLGVAPTFITDLASFGLEPDADPTFSEVVVIREDRMDRVSALIASLGDDDLQRSCDGGETVLSCLCTVFDEEWAHNWYANRDLDVLSRTDS